MQKLIERVPAPHASPTQPTRSPSSSTDAGERLEVDEPSPEQGPRPQGAPHVRSSSDSERSATAQPGCPPNSEGHAGPKKSAGAVLLTGAEDVQPTRMGVFTKTSITPTSEQAGRSIYR